MLDKFNLLYIIKEDFFVPRAWLPIALLKRLEIVLKSIIAQQIVSLLEKQSLFPARYIEGKPITVNI